MSASVQHINSMAKFNQVVHVARHRKPYEGLSHTLDVARKNGTPYAPKRAAVTS